MISCVGRCRTGWVLAILGGLLLIPSITAARPRESSEPIGGITFNPPRPATIRLKNRQAIRGLLIGVSSELLHLRLPNGREFQYDFSDIERIQTHDREFRYSSATDTYRTLKERAGNLTGVTIDDSRPTVDGKPVAVMPRPGPPALPKVVDPPEHHPLEAETPQSEDVAVARAIPEIPQAAPQVPQGNAGPAQPFHQTDTFKIGFLVACIVIILLWWRNRV